MIVEGYKPQDFSFFHYGEKLVQHMDFLKYKLLIWERTVEQEGLEPVIIGVYLKVLIILSWCSRKGFVDYNEYGTFLDSLPSIRLIPKSKKLGIKRLVGFIVIKIIGTRGFLGLYKRLKGVDGV